LVDPRSFDQSYPVSRRYQTSVEAWQGCSPEQPAGL
jgi:hypothetical protein